MLRLDERGNDYIDVSLHWGVEKEKNILEFVRGHVSSNAAAVLTMVAVLGGVNEAKADTGTVDDVYRVADLNSSTPGVPTLDLDSGEFTKELNINGGGEVELNSMYKAVIDNNDRTFKILDRSSGVVVESFTVSYPSTLNTISPVTSLGQGYVVVNGGNKARLFNINDIGASNFNFTDLNTLAVGMPSHLVKHPQTGDVVGVTLFGGGFFSYVSGAFMDNHPLPGEAAKSEEAFKNVGILDSNGNSNTTFSISSVMENGDIHFTYLDSNGNFQYWINPETDEVGVPTPVINSPVEFNMNFSDYESGKELEVLVDDFPVGARLSLISQVDSDLFIDFVEDNGKFTLSSEVISSFVGGDVNETFGISVVTDEGVLATTVIVINLDIIAPMAGMILIDDSQRENGVYVLAKDGGEFNAQGRIGVVVEVAASQSDDLAEGNSASFDVFLIDSDLIGMFEGLSNDQKLNMIKSIMDGEAFWGTSFNAKEGVKVDLELEEGGYLFVSQVFDDMGNVTTSFELLRLEKNIELVSCDEDPSQEKCEPVEESCDVNPNQAKCAPVEVSCDEDPSQDKCEIDDPKNPNNPVTPNNPGNGGGEKGGGCAVPGSAPAAPGKAPLALLGMLAALGLGRRKKDK